MTDRTDFLEILLHPRLTTAVPTAPSTWLLNGEPLTEHQVDLMMTAPLEDWQAAMALIQVDAELTREEGQRSTKEFFADLRAFIAEQWAFLEQNPDPPA